MRIQIEMEVPSEMDPSEILEQCQELAADLFAIQFAEVTDDQLEIVKEEVSVQILNPKDKFKVPVTWTDF